MMPFTHSCQGYIQIKFIGLTASPLVAKPLQRYGVVHLSFEYLIHLGGLIALADVLNTGLCGWELSLMVKATVLPNILAISPPHLRQNVWAVDVIDLVYKGRIIRIRSIKPIKQINKTVMKKLMNIQESL